MTRRSSRPPARDLDLDRDLARALVSALKRATARAYEIERVLERATPRTEAPRVGSVAPGRVSRGLVAMAVRVLPVRNRPRYAEEFRVELVDLPRSQRWGYALRTLLGTWELRRALTETVHAPDGAPARRATER